MEVKKTTILDGIPAWILLNVDDSGHRVLIHARRISTSSRPS
ncbi:MAG: hypothetical protein R6U13_14830 [Desulfatiglandaceae bacterium]